VPKSSNEEVAAAGGQGRYRDGLSVGESLLAAAIARRVRPSSKRAIAAWAAETTLPERFGVPADALTSQHFWDQMDSVPLAAIKQIEQRLLVKVLATEPIGLGAIAYEATNFFTYLDSRNARSQLAQRGPSKQRRHDLRQLGLALMVSEEGQIPLGQVLCEGSRADLKSFASQLEPLRRRLAALSPQPQQLTLVFDPGAESQAHLEQARQLGLAYVTALKPSHDRPWLAEDSRRLEAITLSSGEQVWACRSRRLVHGVEHTVVTVFSPRLYEGQRRGLQQQLRAALRQLGAGLAASEGRDGRGAAASGAHLRPPVPAGSAAVRGAPGGPCGGDPALGGRGGAATNRAAVLRLAAAGHHPPAMDEGADHRSLSRAVASRAGVSRSEGPPGFAPSARSITGPIRSSSSMP
jgi:transposase